MNYKVTGAFFLILLGLWIWLSNLNYLNFKRDWPVILIFIGLDLLFSTFLKKKKKSNKVKILEDFDRGKITFEEAEKKLKEENN